MNTLTKTAAFVAVLALLTPFAFAKGVEASSAPTEDADMTKAMAQLSGALCISGEVFRVENHAAFLILPEKTSATNATPWVWYAPVLPGARLPGPEEKWMFQKFLDAGIAIAGIEVGESYGSPKGRALYSALYNELTAKRGLSKTPCLLARSRGGLMLYNWAAEHPLCVAGVAGIYPVCDPSSYPGIGKACSAYGMTAEEFTAALAQHNPVDRLEPLARAGVLLYHIHGDNDKVVPLDKNSGILARRYAELGGQMILNVVPGGKHDYWPGWFQCQALVDFVITQATKASAAPQRSIPQPR